MADRLERDLRLDCGVLLLRVPSPGGTRATNWQSAGLPRLLYRIQRRRVWSNLSDSAVFGVGGRYWNECALILRGSLRPIRQIGRPNSTGWCPLAGAWCVCDL